jgi:two-component system chemotaxis response regulator CheB
MDFIQKPSQDSLSANMEELHRKLQAVTKTCLEKKGPFSRTSAQFSTKANTPAINKPQSVTPTRNRLVRSSGFDVIAIGISTGGPNALSELIPALPKELGIPILIVQHMPPVFTASLANTLNKKSALHVKEAEDQEAILPDTVYIAPGGRHMTIKKNAGNQSIIALTDDAPVNSCRPSVDVLFRSVPAAYGAKVLSIIMTGMGNDGLAGVRALKEIGCYSLTQSADTCVVYGMPRAVDEQGISDEQVALSNLPKRIMELIRTNG